MSDEREKWARTRIIIISSIFGMLFVAVICQAFRLQILQHEEMSSKADRQHQRVVQLTPGRGNILDRNGNNLAVSLELDSCYAEPRHIQDIDGTAAVLAPFLGTTKQELLKKLNGNKSFVWLERRIPPEKALLVKNLKLRGIGFAPETKRFYPNREIAAHVIGFTGLDPIGLEGIELKYDSTIAGDTGYLVTERDALGRDIAKKKAVVKSSSPGKNVVLTLDTTIQHIVEKELSKAVIDSGAKNGMALVMEPDTGKVLAMANYPTFNPNSYADYSQSLLRNHVVADSYEPGSTFKIFLLAAAIEEKIVRPTDVINCENGKYKIADRTIHDTHSYSRLSVSDVLKYSSNIGSAKIGMKLGDEQLYRYLRNFGFGEKTGIDLPGEASGQMRDRRKLYGADLANISFGQGVAASSVQLTSAVSAVANGGTLMRPYLVERILDDSGREVKKIEPQPLRRVISAETAAKVAQMMEGVTKDGGTGLSAAVDGFRVAGKTGTAQKADPVTRGYSATKRTASFIGFVPAERPRLTILVVIDEPKTSPYGGVVAAPAFRGIAQNTLAYMKMAPTVAVTKPSAVAENKQSPVSIKAASSDGGSVEMPVEGGVMPDFRGMSMRRVLKVMEKQNINIKLLGSGRATEQYPPPGHRIMGVDGVWVKFTPSA
jgi:cell division protein FtsI (penicillin-binding protein 3)